MISKFNFIFGIVAVFALTGMTSCYTLNGFSIDPNVSTFYIGNVENYSANVVADLGNTFREAFQNKVRSDTRLNYSDIEPDIEFVINITRYEDRFMAPTSEDKASFNQLTIEVEVEYIHNKDEKKGWKSKFSDIADFASDANLLDVQDDLIVAINDKIIKRIFDRAFKDW